MRIAMRTILLAFLSLFVAGCGKKGPLIYPDMMIPAASSAVSVRQSGSAIRLQFLLPDKDRAGRPVPGLSGVKISRKTSDVDDKAVCRACVTGYMLFKTIYFDLLSADVQRYGSNVILIDNDVSQGNLYSYGIVPFTADGADGALSVSAGIKIVPEVAAPTLTVEAQPTEMILKASTQLLPSERLVGINFYRRQENGVRSFQPLNNEPYKGDTYVDRALERGVRYVYTARKLIEPEPGVVVESAESRMVAGVLKDDE